MSDEEYEILSKDIATNGQLEPITLFEGVILDGWHRFQACAELNIEPKYKEYDGNDPVAFVLSKNLHRRHLNASQRAVAVTACREWMPNHRPKEVESTFHLISNQALAEEASVSIQTIKDAKAVIKAGKADDVIAGKTTVNKLVSELRGKPADKPKPASKPAPEPEPKPKPENEGDIDLAAEYEAVCEENSKLLQLNESLLKDDSKKEIATWKEKFEAACGRINQLTTTNNEMKKQLEYQTKLFANIRKALRVEKNSEILEAIRGGME